jgi:hypothetical protein
MRRVMRDGWRLHLLAALVALMVSAVMITQLATPANAAATPRRRAESAVPRPSPRSRRGSGERTAASPPAVLRVDAAAPLDERVLATVAWQRDLYESGSRPVTIRPLRRQLAMAFARELAGAGRAAPVVLDALTAATSWRSWNHLRTDLGRSPARASRATELLLRSILAGAEPPARPTTTVRLRR